jgi:hypothetical protein
VKNRRKNHQEEELCFPGEESTHAHEYKVFTDDYDLVLIRETTNNIHVKKK